MTTTTIRSYPAIVGGTLAATIAWCTIIRDVGFTNITLDHIQAASLVGLTVLAGHLANQAWKELRLLASVGLAALAVVGSALTVYNAMGNRAEIRDVKVATATLSDTERSRLQIDLDKTTKLVAEAEAWTATECKSGHGPKCEGTTFILKQRKASQIALQGQLKEVGPVATPEPKAAQVALLAGLAGYDAAKAKKMVSAIEPLAFPLFLELLAIVLFGFGLGHRRAPAPVPAKIEAANDVEPLPPKMAPVEAMPTHSEVVEWRTAFIAKHGRAPRGKELQMVFLAVPKVTAHRWATGANEPREGREVRRIRAA